jgi:ADP-heptose:LPS heptosyltransferase
MRITISSPDGLGDFVLRMPFFEALRDAGHDLQIFMRPPALDLPRRCAAARIEKISEDLMRPARAVPPQSLRLGVKKIGAFAPDLLSSHFSTQLLRRNLLVQASQAPSSGRLSIR